MFCTNCGKPLPDDEVFCEACGTKIEAEQTSARPDVNVQKQELSPGKSNEIAARMVQLVKENKKMAGIVAGAVIVIAALAIFIAARPLTVRLSDYLIVEFTGYNTMGNVSYQFDEEAFCNDYGGKIEYQSEEPFSSIALSDEDICQMFVQDCVSGSFTSTGELSNGDEVTFVWNCDDDVANETYGVHLAYEDLTLTVERLEEAQTVDPFADVEVTFTGIAPNGEAALTNHMEASYAYDLQYEIEPSEGLKNGDVVVGSLLQAASEEEKEYYLRNFGVTFTETQKEYTVSGLGEYVSSLSQIDSVIMEEMRSRGEDALRAEAAQDWNESITLDSMTYLGSYLLTVKDSNRDTRENNMLYLVYQVQSSGHFLEDNIQESFTYYYTVRFDNLVAEPDGSIAADLGEYATPGDRFQKEFGNRRFYYNGYEDLDTAFRECVTSNVDRYSYESSIGSTQTDTTQEGAR